jgi:hypothetical protein
VLGYGAAVGRGLVRSGYSAATRRHAAALTEFAAIACIAEALGELHVG